MSNEFYDPRDEADSDETDSDGQSINTTVRQFQTMSHVFRKTMSHINIRLFRLETEGLIRY